MDLSRFYTYVLQWGRAIWDQRKQEQAQASSPRLEPVQSTIEDDPMKAEMINNLIKTRNQYEQFIENGKVKDEKKVLQMYEMIDSLDQQIADLQGLPYDRAVRKPLGNSSSKANLSTDRSKRTYGRAGTLRQNAKKKLDFMQQKEQALNQLF